jgi:hypothetical protein
MEEKAVTIKTIGIFTIQKRVQKTQHQKTYVVYKQPGDQYVDNFNSLRKAERFSERHSGYNGIPLDDRIISDAGFCSS